MILKKAVFQAQFLVDSENVSEKFLCLALLAWRKVRKLDFQSEFSMSKIIRISLIFFSLKNNKLGAHFLLK